MTTKNFLLIGVITVLGFGLIAGLMFWMIFLKPTEAASEPITSIPLDLPVQTGAAQIADKDETNETADDSAASVTDSISVEAIADEANVENSAAASNDEVEGGWNIFQIVPAESEARFILDETLRGQRTTVIGSTDQVAGEVAIDPNDLARTQLGIFQVNARALETDNNLRNRAIRNRILMTDDYEYIRFTPTALSGLPAESVAPGETVSFQVTGDLTIRDVTNQVVFEMTVTPVSETRLEGFGTTTVIYRDFGLSIPQVPQVADVDEEVVLEIEFVAAAGG